MDMSETEIIRENPFALSTGKVSLAVVETIQTIIDNGEFKVGDKESIEIANAQTIAYSNLAVAEEIRKLRKSIVAK